MPYNAITSFEIHQASLDHAPWLLHTAGFHVSSKCFHAKSYPVIFCASPHAGGKKISKGAA
jgi:hypothetical protein